MRSTSPSLRLFLNMTMIQAQTARRFDARLSAHGISLSEFMILFHLSAAADEKLRRIDLAEKVGLTASGVTRMLAPMEKIGLVQREAYERDARVSYVKLSPGGKNILQDAFGSAEMAADDLFVGTDESQIESFSALLQQMGGSFG